MDRLNATRAEWCRIVAGLGRSLRGLERFEPVVYALFAGVCVLWVAGLFYGSMHQQTLHGLLWLHPDAYAAVTREELTRGWSAPLDDVFIHFDFARAMARGHWFEWSEGNGYSSGGTSLLYPMLLAVGYWLGWRGLSLMLWASVIACVSVFALALAARRMWGSLPRFTSYLAPPAILAVGGLSWSLFSGMEVALFLAIWGGALRLTSP